MEQIISKDRSALVDIAKGVAILCVVAGHSGFPLTLWVNPYSFHMAFFFIIAGFFINTNSGVVNFVLTKFSRLIVPFYVYFFFCAAACLLLTKFIPDSGWKFPKDFLSPSVLLYDPFNRNGTFALIHPLWFLTALFCGMVLFAFFHLVFAKWIYNICWLWKIFFLIMVGQFVVEVQSLLNIDSLWLILSRGLIVACFLGIGYVGWRERNKWDNSTVHFIMTYIFLVVLWRFSPNYVMAQHDYGKGIVRHLFMLCSVSGFITVFGVCKTIKNIRVLSTFIAFCGKKSFILMALHMSAFSLVTCVEKLLLSHDLFIKLSDISYNSWLQRTILFAAGVVLPLLLGTLIDRLRRINMNRVSKHYDAEY